MDEHGGVHLYKMIWSPHIDGHESLGVIGLVQPNGSTLNLAEMQVKVL